MREIKFRAWSESLKEMKYDELYITLDGKLEYDGTSRSHMPLMQFTGLKDKNGVEIYEGDVVIDSHRRRQVVEWVERSHKIGFNIGIGMESVREIIGNIYENPELLT